MPLFSGLLHSANTYDDHIRQKSYNPIFLLIISTMALISIDGFISTSFAGSKPGYGVVKYKDTAREIAKLKAEVARLRKLLKEAEERERRDDELRTASEPSRSNPAKTERVVTFAENGPVLGQLNGADTRLYVNAEWAFDEKYRAEYGAYRYAHTCLSAVYTMIEHSIPGGNKDYRIGQPGTWDDALGATQESLSFSTNANKPFDRAEVEAQLKNGNPVVIHGDSKSGGPGGISDHYMLAVGIDSNGKMIVKDPLSASTITIDLSASKVSIPFSKGGVLNYDLESYRSIKM